MGARVLADPLVSTKMCLLTLPDNVKILQLATYATCVFGHGFS